MLNSKETLKKLHKKFPTMTLDELFDIIDCYIETGVYFGTPVENYTHPYILDPYRYYTGFDKWTVTCDYPKGSVADQISNKLNGGITYADSTHTSRASTRQFESNC